ncbi:Putative pilin/flagellin [Halorhabdus sp. SVX81]|uniref:DUF7289 family protein n=1 Tax=Halorhabdus sp. SVX81 TaxID=2978283 RepID=UPI0023DB616D|nr:hypothetical protein [Halorhabdus sp. SVX81]WEL17875.1 Putative pilin/flagellin [Halorhabdus sp. SVX81]
MTDKRRKTGFTRSEKSPNRADTSLFFSEESTDRALSELVGFSLTFAIIIFSVGLVATVGFSQLGEFRDSQQLDNAEQSFEIVGQSLESIEEGTAVTRIETLDLSGGAIDIERGSTVDITINPGGSTYSIPLNALVYSSGSTNVSYETGATFRQQENGGIMNTGPKFVCTDDVAILSFVTIESTEMGSIQSDGPLEITATHNGTELIYPVDRTGSGSASGANSVTLEFDSPRESLWMDHFSSADNWSVSSSTATCGGSLDRVYVRQTNVSVSFAG